MRKLIGLTAATMLLITLGVQCARAQVQTEWDVDSSMAVDPRYGTILTISNNGYSVFNANGSVVFKNEPLATSIFCAAGNPTTSLPPPCPMPYQLCDPQIAFDAPRGTWIATAIEIGNGNEFLIAGYNANAGYWYVYQIPFAQYPDYLKLGLANNWGWVAGQVDNEELTFDLSAIESGTASFHAVTSPKGIDNRQVMNIANPVSNNGYTVTAVRQARTGGGQYGGIQIGYWSSPTTYHNASKIFYQTATILQTTTPATAWDEPGCSNCLIGRDLPIGHALQGQLATMGSHPTVIASLPANSTSNPWGNGKADKVELFAYDTSTGTTKTNTITTAGESIMSETSESPDGCTVLVGVFESSPTMNTSLWYYHWNYCTNTVGSGVQELGGQHSDAYSRWFDYIEATGWTSVGGVLGGQLETDYLGARASIETVWVP